MGITVIESVTVPTTELPTLWIDDSPGFRMILSSKTGTVADDSPGQLKSVAVQALASAPLLKSIKSPTVAWIGGGLCIGPRLFAIADCRQTVYEIEPALREFCPEGVTFIPGDYRDTITGTYDIIIYDLGGEVPRETLAKHLNPGGKILPEKD
jgi:hypothetical protein